MTNLRVSISAALITACFATSVSASEFVSVCSAAAEEAGKPTDAAKAICECMESEAPSQAVLDELLEAASRPAGERGDGLSDEASAVRDSCRPS